MFQKIEIITFLRRQLAKLHEKDTILHAVTTFSLQQVQTRVPVSSWPITLPLNIIILFMQQKKNCFCLARFNWSIKSTANISINAFNLFFTKLQTIFGSCSTVIKLIKSAVMNFWTYMIPLGLHTIQLIRIWFESDFNQIILIVEEMKNN